MLIFPPESKQFKEPALDWLKAAWKHVGNQAYEVHSRAMDAYNTIEDGKNPRNITPPIMGELESRNREIKYALEAIWERTLRLK